MSTKTMLSKESLSILVLSVGIVILVGFSALMRSRIKLFITSYP